jgi:hypothetical protein
MSESDNNKIEESICVNFTRKEKEWIENLSHKFGVSVAGLIKYCVFRVLKY